MLHVTLEEFKAMRMFIRMPPGKNWDRLAMKYGADRLLRIAKQLPPEQWDEFMRIIKI